MAEDAVIKLLNDFNAKLDAADKDKFSLLGKADNVIGVFANYIGVVGAVVSFIQLLIQIFSKPGPSDLNVLAGLLAEVKDAVGIVDTDVRMFAIHGLLITPDGNLVTLLTEGPTGPDVHPEFFIQIEVATIDFPSDLYWYRPFNPDHKFIPVLNLAAHLELLRPSWYGAWPWPSPDTTKLPYTVFSIPCWPCQHI
jgi:hypothetical protein